jgi:hypothetical protein
VDTSDMPVDICVNRVLDALDESAT